jgi:hypothetical protein
MIDDRWISALRGMDGPVDPDPTFAEELFDSLVRDLRARRSGPPLMLIAAVIALTVLLAGAIAVGSGIIRLPNLDEDLLRSDVPAVPLAKADEWGFGPWRPEYRESWCEGRDAHFDYPREIEGDSFRRRGECSLPDGGAASFEDRNRDGAAFLVRSELVIPTDDGGRRRAERWLASFEDGYPDAVAWLRSHLDDLAATPGMPETEVSQTANGMAVLAGVAAEEGGGGGRVRLWLTTEAELYPAPGCSLTLWQDRYRPDLPDTPQGVIGIPPAPPDAPLVVRLAARDESGRPEAWVYISGEGWGPRARYQLTSETRGEQNAWESGVQGSQITMRETGMYRLEVASVTTACRASIAFEVVDDEDL